MKPPEQLTSLEVRTAIDYIDRYIIAFIGERAKYVKVAAKFKTNETDVRADRRVTEMLQQHRAWAERHELDPDLIEGLYRDLINHFTQKELTHWKQEQ
jgi:isochorismate pyruvate lyase